MLTIVGIALYAAVLISSPFEHHDLICHLKTPQHCTSCTSSQLGSDTQILLNPGVWHLADAGRAIAVQYVAEDTQYVCPGLEDAAEDEIRALALAAFDALGCAGWGRVDIMRDRQGRNWLLEANTAPGMTAHSLVPKAARQMGIEFDELCWRILEMTMEDARA